MLEVVPTHEAGRPGAGLLQIGKALGGELGAVLGGTKQRLGVGVVIAHARPRVRGLDSQLSMASTVVAVRRCALRFAVFTCLLSHGVSMFHGLPCLLSYTKFSRQNFRRENARVYRRGDPLNTPPSEDRKGRHPAPRPPPGQTQP